MASWLFVGQGLFVLVGSTTFASLLLLLANSLQFHDWLARKLALHLAKHTGLEVSFGETIVPNWRTGKISFRQVHIKSIPGLTLSGHALYDLTIDKAEVSLSVKRWLEGKGLILSGDVSGVRGTIDKRHVSEDGRRRAFRHKGRQGNFDLERVALRDILLTVFSADGFRPYQVSLISADLPRLRKRFFLYDFLTAENVVGVLDGSLFSLYVPQCSLEKSTQTRSRLTAFRHLKMHSLNVDFFSKSVGAGPLSLLTRGSVDVDVFIQLPSNYGGKNEAGDQANLLESISSKLGSATEGILVEILRDSSASDSPSDAHGTSSVGWIWTRLSSLKEGARQAGGALLGPFPGRLCSRIQKDILNVDDRATETPEAAAMHFLRAKPDTLSFKVDFRFHNLRAHLPWTTDDLMGGGIIGTAFLRPMVAYINEQRPFIPISCHFDLSMDMMDGAWTLYESGIMDAVSRGATDSFELLVHDRQKKMRRLKRVSLWSLYAVLRNLRHWMSEMGMNVFYYPWGSFS